MLDQFYECFKFTNQTGIGFYIKVWDDDGKGVFGSEDDLVDVYEKEIKVKPSRFTSNPRFQSERFYGKYSSMGVTVR